MKHPTLRRLIYLSASYVEYTPNKIEALLQKIRVLNLKDDITGLLVYAQGSFFQVLEGPDETLQATFHRISKDPSHGGMIILSDEPISTRVFQDWSMGYARPEDLSPAARVHVSDISVAARFGTGIITDDPVIQEKLAAFLGCFDAVKDEFTYSKADPFG